MTRKNWDRQELILAINLYFKTEFGKIHNRNPEIIKLAKYLNRSPSSVGWKLVNFASFDPSLKKRGIKGATHTSKLDKKVWDEFYNNLDVLSFESEKLLAELKKSTVEKLNNLSEIDLLKEGKTKEQFVKIRVNQSFFRKTILASYNNTCCITGIKQSELLIAGHIKPWGIDKENRLNPRNGIAINALHDKAFETGLITITPDYKIKVSSVLKKQEKVKFIQENFCMYENRSIILPTKFLPDKEFLQYHNEQRFRA
ncbi:HNH endonuclease [bacterium BMS3Abin03]|nr:HNH endonuclease [bacterium BMS3Abin03]